MHPIDEVLLLFEPSSLVALRVVLALIMFGVALDLSVDDFRRLAKTPWAPLIGLACQFAVLPALTFVLVGWLAVPPSVALGMILVAACPGGNLSNYLTQVGGGRIATSVGMTAVSTLAAVVTTPTLLTFWGSRRADTAQLLSDVALDPWSVVGTVAMLLVVPVTVGMAVADRMPVVAARLRAPMRVLSLVAFVLFVAIAFGRNVDHFLAHVHTVFVPVLLMNGLALALGWGAAYATGLDVPDRRAVSVEVGIQNAGLGLVIVFESFDALGGMAVVAAWWGIWHLVSGLAVTAWWRWRDRRAD